MIKPAYIYLGNNTLLQGTSFGVEGTSSGEICFSTSMTGYQETFTDPSYAGQILIMNVVHMGNYGVTENEKESDKIHLKGVISRSFEEKYSRHLSQQSLQEYFVNNNIIAVSNIDTRCLVKKVRENGAMNIVISTETNDISTLQQVLNNTPAMNGQELASEVCTKKAYILKNENSECRIAVMDFGLKNNIINHLMKRGAFLKIFPSNTSTKEILDFNPDGLMLTNGPGDPSSMEYCIQTIKEIVNDDIPTFGICLGHQLLCKSVGLPTYKLLFGHRGINHPVKNLEKNTCEITTQNHGFGVRKEDIETSDKLTITHLNLNDDTIEGIRLKDKPAFSVQYHPEATPGPHDSTYLFDDFFSLIKKHKKQLA